jgi:hypothetical protein
VVASWEEHLLQRERVTKRDQERYAAILALADPARPPTVTHWLTPLTRRARRAAERQAGSAFEEGEMLVDGADGRGPFANGGGDALGECRRQLYDQ